MTCRKSKTGRKSLKAVNKGNIVVRGKPHRRIENVISEKDTGNRQHYVREIVLRGTFHQGDPRFENISRGRQCTANAALAIAMSHFTSLLSWTAATIDSVLLHGNRLYIDSISKRNVPSNSESNREFLRVTELSRHFELLGKNLQQLIDEQICIDGNLIHDLEGFPNLKKGLNLFFNDHVCGILTTKGVSLAIFKAHDHYWVFDSHARGLDGRQACQDGTACLIRFNDIESLYDLLACNLSLESINDILTDYQYTLMPVYLTIVDIPNMNTNVNFRTVPRKVEKHVRTGLQQHMPHEEKYSSTTVENISDSVKDESLKRKRPKNTMPKRKKVKVIQKKNQSQVQKNVLEPEVQTQSQASGKVMKWTNVNRKQSKRKDKTKKKKANPIPADRLKDQENVAESEVLLQIQALEQCVPSGFHQTSDGWSKHEREFHTSIWKFADTICSICNKIFYKPQTCTVLVNESVRAVIPTELKDVPSLIVCNRCGTTIKKGKCPTQAYWNAMFLDPIPEVIESLTDIEKRLISMVVPFIKIIKLGGRFGQYGFKGQAVLFAQDVGEVIEQLPVSITSTGIAIVCEKLENVTREREFQVNVEKLLSALAWLKENNALYSNVKIDYSNTNFDITQICQIVDGEAERIANAPQAILPQASELMKDIKGSRGILRGSLHQGNEHFAEISRGNQCTANAAVAIAMTYIVSLPSWTKGTIDTILINGDRLFTESISNRNIPYINAIDSDYLAAVELHPTVELLGNVCDLFIDDSQCIYGHLDRDDQHAGFRKLRTGLDFFFRNHPFGILIANGISLAVFKIYDYFWMFDSNARGPNGRKASTNGTACLMRFISIQSLFKLLKCNIPKSVDKTFGGQYSLTPVQVILQPNISIHTAQLQTLNTAPDSPGAGDEMIVMTSVLRPVDECIPQLDSILSGCSINDGNPVNDIPLRTLQRKTAPPLQLHVERRAEELAWFYLFPNGRNGLNESTRQLQITPLDYCQARVMSADRRFQRNDYLFYALSVMEYHRARQNVGVCLRLRQGDVRPEGLVNNLYLNMRGLRGSNAYWQTACSDLVAMVRNLGPPTWFVTLSCNDLNWNDMLTACLIAAGRREEKPDDLRWEDKMKLIEEHPVTLSRQFMVRLHAIMRILKRDNEMLGGKLVDYWWRIEFQNRGSPHLHMLCWNEGIPSFESCEGIAVIDQVVWCTSKPQNEELATLVHRVQIHRHSSTCYKNRSDGQYFMYVIILKTSP